MAYGDLFKSKDQKFSYLSYQLSLTNGYLPTLNDDNKSKDFVGRITIRPVEKLRIIGCYNWGEYKGLNENGDTKDYLPMNRFITGAWYYDPKVDYTMYSTEVQEYMKKSFPNVNNIVICGLEVGETGVVKSRPMCA